MHRWIKEKRQAVKPAVENCWEGSLEHLPAAEIRPDLWFDPEHVRSRPRCGPRIGVAGVNTGLQRRHE